MPTSGRASFARASVCIDRSMRRKQGSDGVSAQLRTASVTDTGRRRRHNEDAYVCEPPLFAVADGMGGAQAGELASSLAAAALRDETSELAGGEQRVDDLI